VRYKKYRQQDQLQAFSVRLALPSVTRKVSPENNQ